MGSSSFHKPSFPYISILFLFSNPSLFFSFNISPALLPSISAIFFPIWNISPKTDSAVPTQQKNINYSAPTNSLTSEHTIKSHAGKGTPPFQQPHIYSLSKPLASLAGSLLKLYSQQNVSHIHNVRTPVPPILHIMEPISSTKRHHRNSSQVSRPLSFSFIHVAAVSLSHA